MKRTLAMLLLVGLLAIAAIAASALAQETGNADDKEPARIAARDRENMTRDAVARRIEAQREETQRIRDQQKGIAQERREEWKVRVEERKRSYDDAQEQFKECLRSNATNRSDCRQERVQLRTQAKESVMSGLENGIAQLKSMRAQLADDASLDPAKKQELLAKMDERIQHLSTITADVKKLTSNSTPEAFQKTIGEVRNAWQNAKEEARKASARFANAKTGVIVQRMEQLSDKLDTTVQRFQNQGTDTTSVQSLKTTFDQQIADAKALYDQAVAQWSQPDLTAEQVFQANSKLKQANQKLQEAHQTLKQILAQLKGLQPAQGNNINGTANATA